MPRPDDVHAREDGGDPRPATAPRLGGERPKRLSGRTIDGKIRVGGIVGAGGMGVVYEGEHLGLQTKVAIKVLHEGGDGRDLARFRTEARALANLRHPHIVQVFDFGVTEDGTSYMVTELLAGRTADAILAEHGHLPWRWVLALLRQLLSGLAFAHELGIVHRDVKPSNCLCVGFSSLDDPPRGKLLDFGVAKLLGGEIAGPTATQAGEIIGTAAYMSPEQASGLEVDGRSDLYSVGATAYELLTGVPLFQGATSIDLLWQHVHAEPQPLDAVNPRAAIPREVAALVLRAVAKDPDARPATARELLGAVEAVLDAAAEPPTSAPSLRIETPPESRAAALARRRLVVLGSAAILGSVGIAWGLAGAPAPVGRSGGMPRSCADLLAADPDLPSATYRIDPDGPGGEPPYEAFCDMARDGGGWTLVAKIHRARGQGLAGAQSFLALQMNEHLLRGEEPPEGTEPLVSSHGRARLSALVAGSTVSRFDLLAQNDAAQRATWFKAIDADAFFRWFTAEAHLPTAVCLDPELQRSCAAGRIVSESRDLSGAVGRVTVLEGMNLADHGYRTEGEIHVRLSGDDFNHLAGVCSYTFFDEAWHDSLDGHWGNGLEIWVR